MILYVSEQYHVTLAVYSGLPDPEWSIKPNDVNYQRISELFNAAKRDKLTQKPKNMPSRLGYKGFLVRENKERSDKLILGPKTKELQKLLLQTTPKGSVSEEMINVILEEVDKEQL